MRQLNRPTVLLSFVVATCTIACERGEGHAHEKADDHAHGGEHGHGHGHDDGHGAAEEEELPGAAITHFTRAAADQSETELFVEFGVLIVGEEVRFAAHMTDCGELYTAIDSGTLEVKLGPPEAPNVFLVDGPSVPGIFRPSGVPQTAGKQPLRFVLTRGERVHVHDVGEVTVFADRAAARAALADVDEDAPAGQISFLKEQAWKLDFSLTEVTKRPMADTLRVFGELTPATGGVARVASPASGTVVAPPGGLKAVGARVRRGETLATVVPSIGGGGNLAAILLRKEKAALAVELAERELARVEGLLASGAVPARRVDEARGELQRARAEGEGAARLLAQHEGAVAGGSVPGGLRIVAPIDGIVTAAPMVAGGFVDEGGEIATLVDTRVLWLTAHVPEVHRARATRVFGGAFRSGRGPWTPFVARAEGYETSAILDAADRTFPVRVPLVNDDGALAAGTHVEVELHVGAPREVIALDKRAVLFEGGVPVVFAMREGEAFERLVVDLGAEASGLVEVRRGAAEGDRVATVGAMYVKLASVAGAAPAHGHPH